MRTRTGLREPRPAIGQTYNKGRSSRLSVMNEGSPPIAWPPRLRTRSTRGPHYTNQTDGFTRSREAGEVECLTPPSVSSESPCI